MQNEYWSQEEIKTYCENPHLLLARVNAMRYQMLCEMLSWLKTRIAALCSRTRPTAVQKGCASPHPGK